MAKNELVYSFDLGSGSIGVCARSGKNILYLDSLLIDADFASVKDVATRRRQYRTRIAHKKREKWWEEQAKKAGIEVLLTAQPTKENPNLKPDNRMLIEFPPEGSKDKTIYSSHLLRIALLQGVKLEGWQVYKAIRSAMQRRGYDKVPWATDYDKLDKDEKANSASSNRYDEKLKEFFKDKEEFYYPCYYEAYIQGIWDPNSPNDFSKRLSTNPAPARNKESKPAEDKAFPSRHLVEKELKMLLEKAAVLFPKLKGKEDFIIYGLGEKPYASYKDDNYKKYRGTAWDWQGLLGQKVPRFDNRIIAKCRLIPRLNVCNAKKQINKDVSFLFNLKNMRYSNEKITSMALSPKQVNEVFEIYLKYIKTEKENAANKNPETKIKIKPTENPFTKTFWKEYVKKFDGWANPGQQEIAKPKESGRSSFCKPALYILQGLILSGKNPHDYYKELIDANKNTDIRKGLVKEDYEFLRNMPNDWNSISIQDTREADKKLSDDEAKDKIEKIISGISNRIVRHRLTMLLRQLEKLNDKFKKEYGLPDKVIFEIAREDFVGAKKKKEYQDFQNANKKENDLAVKDLKKMGLGTGAKNILKMKLGNQQKWTDIYDTSEKEKRKLIPQNIEQYEIDHIVPQGAKGGSDSFSNFVLTKNSFNQKKSGLTPYEWFHKERPEDWDDYIKNIYEIYGKNEKNKKKIELLISDKACDIEKRKTDLQATSYIEKLAQTIAGLYFGFGINTKNDKKRIFFYTGGETATVRSKLDLNKLLYTTKEEFEKAKHSNDGLSKKNRSNKKHHALDALVLSMLPEIKISKREIEEKPVYFDKIFCERKLKPVEPHEIRTLKPALRLSISALRKREFKGLEPKYFFVNRFENNIEKFLNLKYAKKTVKKIFDLTIQKDFETKLKDSGLNEEKWQTFLKQYCGYDKQKKGFQKIKKLTLITDRCPVKGMDKSEVFDDNGELHYKVNEHAQIGKINKQWFTREEKTHGFLIYKENGKYQTETIAPFESTYKKIKEAKNKDGKVYHWYSGCKIKIENNINGSIIDLVDKKQKRSKANIKAGSYKLNTISSNVFLTSLETGKKYAVSLSNLLDEGLAKRIDDE